MLVLQLSSLANLAVVAALADADWHGNKPLFKVLLGLFPLAWALEFVYIMFYVPPLDEVQHPDKAVSQRASRLVLLSGVVGSVLMIIDNTHYFTSENTQHAFASATVFLFITRNLYFSRMVLAFCRVLVRCFSLITAIFMFMLLFCQASKDIFGDKVGDPDGELYFDTNTHALITLFRLFTGNEWNETMLRATAATSEAALLWFFMYVFLGTMFCCELFVGVIISEFVEIHSIKSPRLFNALEPIFEFGPTEREAVLAGLLSLNRKMQPYNRAFFAVLDNSPSSQKIERHVPSSQDVAPKRLLKSASELFPAVLSQILAIDTVDQIRVYNEYQIRRLDKDELYGTQQLHISQCVPVLMVVLGQEMVSITKACPLNKTRRALFDAVHKQHQEAVTNWLIGIMASMCTEGITDHFLLSKHGNLFEKSLVLEYFQDFGSNNGTATRFGDAAKWNGVRDACHKAVDKIFDLYHGEAWLVPSDAQSAHLCTKQLCSLLAIDELVHYGEVFYQQATSGAPTLSEEEIMEARKWHRPFIWGMRMYQVMQTVRNSKSLSEVVSMTAEEIVAAAVSSGIDISDNKQLVKFTKAYASSQNAVHHLPAHLQIQGVTQIDVNPVFETESDVSSHQNEDHFDMTDEEEEEEEDENQIEEWHDEEETEEEWEENSDQEQNIEGKQVAVELGTLEAKAEAIMASVDQQLPAHVNLITTESDISQHVGDVVTDEEEEVETDEEDEHADVEVRELEATAEVIAGGAEGAKASAKASIETETELERVEEEHRQLQEAAITEVKANQEAELRAKEELTKVQEAEEAEGAHKQATVESKAMKRALKDDSRVAAAAERKKKREERERKRKGLSKDDFDTDEEGEMMTPTLKEEPQSQTHDMSNHVGNINNTATSADADARAAAAAERKKKRAERGQALDSAIEVAHSRQREEGNRVHTPDGKQAPNNDDFHTDEDEGVEELTLERRDQEQPQAEGVALDVANVDINTTAEENSKARIAAAVERKKRREDRGRRRKSLSNDIYIDT